MKAPLHPVSGSITREAETTASKTARNQLSAVRVGRKIYVSTATGKNQQRTGGVIHTFALNQDNTLTLVATHSITENNYGYSCLADLPGSGLALLYESGQGEITFRRIGIM
jgi:hypothetical protein